MVQSHIEYTSVFTDSQTIPDLKYNCRSCSESYYTRSSENNIISYHRKDNTTFLKMLEWEQENESCIQCPYGALCTGNNVRPRPNFWGYLHKGMLEFHQCPEGYCCSNTEDSMCNVYDYCRGNRTGIICGACQAGLSVSILTQKCIPDSQCGGDQWFWLVVTLYTIAYAL